MFTEDTNEGFFKHHHPIYITLPCIYRLQITFKHSDFKREAL